MKTLRFSTYRLFAIVSFASICGCGVAGTGSTSSVPLAAPKTDANPATGSSGDLLYVGNTSGYIAVFSYPSLQQVQTLHPYKNYAIGASNANDGDMCFVAGEVDLWHRGSTTYTKLPSSKRDQFSDCAFDPTTNNIAGSLLEGKGPAVIAVYSSPSSNPTYYSDSKMNRGADFTAYDGNGNLFVDGQGVGGQVLDELPKGTSTLVEIALDKNIVLGSLTWDGTYITTRNNEKFYRLSFSGSEATVVGRSVLKEAFNAPADGYEIENGVAIGKAEIPNGERVGLWNYPAGGKPSHVLKVHGLTGAAISAIALSLTPSIQARPRE